MSKELPYDDEFLVNYLDGNLPEEQKAALELQLQTDAILGERLEKLRLSIAAIRYYGTAQKVQSIHQQMMKELPAPQQPGRIVPIRKWARYSIAIAASVLLIFVAVRIHNGAQPSAGKLYDEAFVDYTAAGTRSGETSTIIERFYSERQYDSVLARHQLANTQKDSLLTGLSFLKKENYSEAIRCLKGISLHGSYQQDAEFYLALAYLRNKNIEASLSLVRKIQSDPQHPYREQFSQDFVQRLERLHKLRMEN